MQNKLTERDSTILAAIRNGLNGIASADQIAARLGYKPARSGRLSVTASLRRLERADLVGRIAPADRWGHADWFITPALRALNRDTHHETR